MVRTKIKYHFLGVYYTPDFLNPANFNTFLTFFLNRRDLRGM